MILTKQDKNFLNKNYTIVLSTCDLEHKVNSVFVEICKIEDNNIIITDNEMKKTKKNILENKNVCILAYDKKYNVLKIFGRAGYHTKGKYFDYVKNFKDNIGHNTKGAVVIKVNKIIKSC